MPLSPDTQRQLEHYHDRITFRQEPDDLRPAPPCRLRGAQVFRQLDFRGRVAAGRIPASSSIIKNEPLHRLLESVGS